MSQTAPTHKVISAVFIALTAIFAASTGYLLANPTTMTQLQTVTMTVTSTAASSIEAPLYTVNVAYNSTLGFYLTNGTGWTLYVFTRDIPTNGTSRCTGNCIKAWPAFYSSSLNLPPGLDAGRFTVITRPDGSKQLAFDGWPLYYFVKDTKPGDVTGQGVNNVWFTCTVPVLKLGT